MEVKVYSSNLIELEHFSTNMPPELKEFAKARYYYLSNKVAPNWRPNKDYGPVATGITNLVIGKGPTSAQEEYRLFKERMRL